MSDRAILDAARADHKDGRLEVAELLYRQLLDAEPEHPEATYLLGVVELQRGNAERAVYFLERATRLDPTSAEVLNHYGIALKAAGRLEEAGQAFDQSIARDPRFAEAHYNRGTVLQATGVYETAAEAFRNAIAHDSEYADAHLNLGGVLRSLGCHEAAVAAMERALELRPGWLVALFNLAVAFRESGRLGESLKAVQAVLNAEPTLGAAWLSLGETQRALGDQYAAADAFERAAAQSNPPQDALYNLALIRLRLGEFPAATEAIQHYLARSRDASRGLALHASIAAESGDVDTWRRLMDFEQLVRRVPIVDCPAAEWPDLAAFNHAICEHVRSHPSLRADPDGQATRGGWHSDRLQVEHPGPMEALAEIIEVAIREYVDALNLDPSHPFLLDASERPELAMWGVMLGVGGHQTPHTHSSAWISGVYYPGLGNSIGPGGEDRSGWIEFGQPTNRFCCDGTSESYAVQPEESLLVLFPAYFHQRVIAIESGQPHISIGFSASRPADPRERTGMRAEGY